MDRIFASPVMVHALYRYASGLGLAPEPLFAAAGIPPEVLHTPGVEARVSIARYNALWESIVACAGDPHFGLHLGEAAGASLAGDVLMLVMRHAPTVGDALERLCRYHDLATNAVRLRLEREGARGRLVWHAQDPSRALDRHHWEAVLSGIALRLRDLASGRPLCSEVQFGHAPPGDTSEHARIFCCPVRFARPDNALVIPVAALEIPIPMASPALLEHLEAFADAQLAKLNPRGAWAGDVVRTAGEMLGRGERPTLKAVAGALSVSTRCLQDHLQAEGCTYRALLDDLRREIALEYLARADVSLYDVAFLLGFSEQSAFNHAFKRWTGSTPNEHRARGGRRG